MTVFTRHRGKLHEAVERLFTEDASFDPRLNVRLYEPPKTLVRYPDGRLRHPYGILYPGDAVPFDGGTLVADEHFTVPYQLTAVGDDGQHAQWMADTCRGVLLTRHPSGEFLKPITVPDLTVTVTDRRPVSLGQPEPAGDGLFQVVELYELEVSA